MATLRENFGRDDIKKFMDENGEFVIRNIILTRFVCISFLTHKHRRNLNILVIGGSGAGKTRFFVIPNILNCNSSFIILDPKGEILRTTGGLLKKKGYVIKVLDLLHMEKSDCFNPFWYIESVKDIQVLVTNFFASLTPKNSQSQDPFWDAAASILLKAVMCLLWLEAPKEEQNFDTVMEVLRSAQVREEDESFQSPLDILFEKYREKDPDHIAVKFYDDFKQAAGKTAKLAESFDKLCLTLPAGETVVTLTRSNFPSAAYTPGFTIDGGVFTLQQTADAWQSYPPAG